MTEDFKKYEELYGSYVQVNDRFDSVHIWSEEVALINKGRYTPTLISKVKYLEEKEKSWNKK